MKPNAIVFTSNTGYTAQYAKLLGEKTGLPVLSLEQANKQLCENESIFYLGWIMAGQVKGWKKAAKRFNLFAVCGVGMGSASSQIQDIKKANSFPDDMPVFALQGGFDITKLHGIYKFMMTVMSKTVGKSLAEKSNRTAEEELMLKLLTQGGSCVCEQALDEILDFIN